MTPRENLLSLFRRRGYESAPVEFGLCPSLEEEYRRQTGSPLPYPEYFRFPWEYVPGLKLPPCTVDWTRYYDRQFAPNTQFSNWGVAHEPGEGTFHMSRMHHPMERFDSLEQFQAYPYPDYAAGDGGHMAGTATAIRQRGLAAGAGQACTIWETAWYMRGMEQLMMDMMTDSELAVYHLDRVTEQACIMAAAYARAGVDFIQFGDDIGMQQTIMMSESLYRTWLKPRLARVIATARAIKPDLVVAYHSCGYVIPFIPDLIEVGVDVLNPVQPECMDFAAVHAEFGERLSFWGTLGTQTTLPFGSPEEVRQMVHRNLGIAGKKGGLLCSPTHMVEPEVPWANLMAYVAACREWRP